MSPPIACLLALLLAAPLAARPSPAEAAAPRHSDLTISGTRFLRDGELFPYTGLSFFNAIYNPAFNRSAAARRAFLRTLQGYGITVIRVWAQWDGRQKFVDMAPEHTLYHPDGELREAPLATLQAIIADAETLDLVVQVAMFSHESTVSGKQLPPAAADCAVAALTRALLPFRNVTLQVWNEHDDRTEEHVKAIKAIDPRRLVTSSPGWPGTLGDPPHNRALDFLTPHTSRQSSGRRHWEIAPLEIASLLATYGKPVVDDEPARNGTSEHGGPRGAVSPYDQILQIAHVWRLGAYTTYHHDMFQTGYGSAAVPASGMPEPAHNPHHRQVLEFIAQRERYMAEDLLPPRSPAP